MAPQQSVQAYDERVSSGARQLKNHFKDIEQTTRQGVFDNPDTSPAERLQQLQNSETQNLALMTAIAKYKSDVASYDRARYTGLVVTYADADHVKQNVDNMTSQSLEVLQEYAATIAFLKGASYAQEVLERHIQEINAVSDFNTLAGMHESIYARARHIREARKALELVEAPQEYLAAKAALLAQCDSLAAGIDALAYGMYTAIDSYIYGATAEIERATHEYDTKNKNLVFEANQVSPTLKSVSELSEKLEILEEAGLSD